MSTSADTSTQDQFKALAARLHSFGLVGDENVTLLLTSPSDSVDCAGFAADLSQALKKRLGDNVAVLGPSLPGPEATESISAASLMEKSRAARDQAIAELKGSFRVVLIAGESLDDEITTVLGPLADTKLLVLDFEGATEAGFTRLRQELDLHTLRFDGFLAVGHRDTLPPWVQQVVG